MASFGGNYGKAQGGSGPGGKGPTGKSTAGGGNSTVADHMIATGAGSAPSIPAGGVAKGNYATQDEAYDHYAKAVGGYATRSTLSRVADFLAGPLYDQKEPMAGNPRSFAGGTFHSSSNPAGVLAGLAAPFGTGAAVGPAAANLYQKAGLPDIWHGGYEQPDIRPGPFGNAPAGTDMGKTFAQMGGMSSPGGSPLDGPANSPGKGTQSGSQMAAFGQPAQAPGGAAFGAQPTAQTASNPMGAFFSPKLPNHTLPQGYNSMFPNSLSDADKAMLYAKALA